MSPSRVERLQEEDGGIVAATVAAIVTLEFSGKTEIEKKVIDEWKIIILYILYADGFCIVEFCLSLNNEKQQSGSRIGVHDLLVQKGATINVVICAYVDFSKNVLFDKFYGNLGSKKYINWEWFSWTDTLTSVQAILKSILSSSIFKGLQMLNSQAMGNSSSTGFPLSYWCNF